ncbi:MAG TPA: energy transducer TonB [Thermoanaerobaculia bacterium]|jgi:protein TonB|nr:energy transducer TonB [Thermoanaerobaculia bacterium]
MFEHSLIDLDSKPRRPRRWISLPVAVGLHVAGFTAFAFASYWNVDKVAEPRTNVVFLSLAPLPELPAGGGGQRPPATPPVNREPQAPTPPQQPVQPTAESVPETIPTAPTIPVVENVISGPVSGDTGPGFSEGPECEGCQPGPGFGPGPVGPGTGPSGDGDADQPRVITVGMTKPVVVHQVQPRYTELARRAGIQGTVIVEAVIDQKGYVTNARVLRGLPMGLDRAAIEAIQQWRFKPATLKDEPVKVFFVLTVNFTIQH